jgi:tetratricopeptide (TPR) repeat protein
MSSTDYSSTHSELPRDAEELVGLGSASLGNGDVDQALRCFQAVLTIDQAQKVARTELGILTHSAEAPTAPQKCAAYMGLGYLARQQGRSHGCFFDADRLDIAEAVFKKALDHEPSNIRALMGLGYLARKRGDRAAALANFEAARAVGDLGAWLEAATELLQLGRCNEAESLYKALLDRSPGHVGALVGLGKLMRRRGEPDTALTLFENAAAANPDDPSARIEIADVLVDLGRYDDSEAMFRTVLERGARAVGIQACGRAKECQSSSVKHLGTTSTTKRRFTSSRARFYVDRGRPSRREKDKNDREQIRARALSQLGIWPQAHSIDTSHFAPA